LNTLYLNAVALHLRLFVFFEQPTSENYSLYLNELYEATRAFLGSALDPSIDLKHAPNYILQMLLAAAAALLKLLNSFFASVVNRDAGKLLFWDTIEAIRSMSVEDNDLPQRLGEVFAQMWQNDDQKMAELAFADTKPSMDAMDESLTLNLRLRMSMSHVFDCIWRWRDEVQGKVRAEQLDAAVKDPTSPQATTHRGSLSNGRRSASVFLEDAASSMPGMTSFSTFGGLQLGGIDNSLYPNLDAFDPGNFFFDQGFFGPTELSYPQV
jgi:hypothetical protein